MAGSENQFINEIEAMANELAAVQYIDGIFRKAFNFEFEMA